MQGVPLGPGPTTRLVPIDESPLQAGGGKVQPPGLNQDPGSNPSLSSSPELTPLIPLPPLMSAPLNGGMPTGFVGSWGDYYLAGSAATPGKLRDGVVDGSVALGIGLGDPINAVGVDLSWGIGSVKNFGANGGFNGSIGRVLVNQPKLVVSVAGGVINAFAYGTELNNGLDSPSNGYGAVSAVLPLRPSDPVFRQMLQLSAGIGGNFFAPLDVNFQGPTTGGFVAAGVELSPQVGVSMALSGRGTNLSLGWVPFPRLPVFVNLLAADVFAATPYGTVGVITIGWSDNILTGFFRR